MAWKNIALLKTTPRYDHGATVTTAVAAYADANGINSMSSYEVGWGTAHPDESFLPNAGRYIVSRLAIGEQFKFALDDTHYVRVQRIADSVQGVIAQLRVFIANGGSETIVKTRTWRYSDQGHYEGIGFLVNSATSEIDLFVCVNYWPINQPEREKGYNQSLLSEQPLMRGVLFNMFNGLEPVADPYDQGGNSTVDNTSSGTFDATSDSIAVPATPSLSAQSGGLIALYEIDAANMLTFANYLFGGFDPTNFHKLFESPMEAILCLNYFPYTPPAAATATEISFGSTGTGANGYLLSAQYDEIDCGTVDLDPYYGSCLDFAPYTRVSLVLPYCGTAELDPDEFMGKSIGVVYKVDCYTGACLAIVTADGDVLVQVAGTLANPLPISASNYSSILSSIATVAVASATAIATVATGGASTPVAVALTGSLGATAAGSVMSAKPHYNHGGTGGVGSGLFGVQKPYLIIKRPRQCLPENNNNFQGYPSFVTKVLGNCYGFTKVNEIHLDGLSATDGEKKELEAILKGGVWF